MGGNIFKGKTQSIKIENIESTVDKYFQELAMVFPHKKIFDKKHFTYLGSVGKKPVSGDIDFGIDSRSIVSKNFSDKSIKEWGLNPDLVKEQMLKYKKRAKTATDEELMMRAILKGIVDKINSTAINLYCDEKKITAGNIFGLFPQYTPEGEKLDYGVQMDWMVGNLDLLRFSYYSDEYPQGYKGLMRTQLMVALFKNIDVTYSHLKGITDIKTKKLIANNPKDIIEYANDTYGFKITRNVIDNYFSFVEYLEDNLDKNVFESILNIYFNILSHTRVDIPKNLHKIWRKLNKKEHYETKFLPDNSLLKEDTQDNFFDYINEMGRVTDIIDASFHNRESDWVNRDKKMTTLIKKDFGSLHYRLYKIYNQYFLTNEYDEYFGSIEFEYDELKNKIGKIKSSYKKTKIKRFYSIMFTVLLDTGELKEIHSDTNISTKAYDSYKSLGNRFNLKLSNDEDVSKYKEYSDVYIIVKEDEKNILDYWQNRIDNEDSYYEDGTLFTEGVYKKCYNYYDDMLDAMMFGNGI